MAPELVQHLEAIRALCRRYRVKRLDVFGSAATGGFDPPSSDHDFVVGFEPQERRGLDDVYFRLVADLEALLGRPADLVEAHVPRNPCFIASMNRQRRGVHAA